MDVARLIGSRRWWHSIEIGDLVTPGQVPLSYLREILGHLRLPESLAGLSVLDIGAWDGFFSFEAEKRGAARVVAYDLHPPDYYGFSTARELLGSKVEYVQGSVYDLRTDRVGGFDVVFFFGVLYHLRHPLLALDRIREVTNGYALIETHHLDGRMRLPDGTWIAPSAIDPRLTEIALYQFYRNDELQPGDFSNWFALNRRAIEEALWSAGFRPEYLATWGDRIAFKAIALPGIPEYRQQTYEGLTWRMRPDGTQDPVMPQREVGLGPGSSLDASDPDFPPTGDVAQDGVQAASGFEAAFARIREPKRAGAIGYEPGSVERIVERLAALGLGVRAFQVDVSGYRRFAAAARYPEDFPDYYPFNVTEKLLEHYVAATLLDLRAREVYIDVASAGSPAPDLYRRVFGVTAYRQDLTYAPGVNGDRIGSDATAMPVPEGFAAKMALHCSFQHFEGDRDMRFVGEAARVLAPGGAVCVVPLYLAEEYAIQTDPEVAVPAGASFERDAIVYCARGWGNRHGRFYDPEHLRDRVMSQASEMTAEVYWITNAEEVDASCYVRFAMLLQRLRAPADVRGGDEPA